MTDTVMIYKSAQLKIEGEGYRVIKAGRIMKARHEEDKELTEDFSISVEYGGKYGENGMGMRLSREKMQELIKSKKAKPTNEVAVAEDGPWKPLKNVYKSIMNK